MEIILSAFVLPQSNEIIMNLFKKLKVYLK